MVMVNLFMFFYVWFLVLVNGSSTCFINSLRGLRQGDPLLFLLVVEVLK